MLNTLKNDLAEYLNYSIPNANNETYKLLIEDCSAKLLDGSIKYEILFHVQIKKRGLFNSNWKSIISFVKRNEIKIEQFDMFGYGVNGFNKIVNYLEKCDVTYGNRYSWLAEDSGY